METDLSAMPKRASLIDHMWLQSRGRPAATSQTMPSESASWANGQTPKPLVYGHIGKSYFFYLTFMKVRFFFLNSKTEQTTSLNFLNRVFYLPRAVSKAGLLQ